MISINKREISIDSFGEKPVVSFLFSGPTGVGKTEVSKQLAQIMGI